MKILMTTDSVGGVWTYSMELIKGLAAYDVEVVLASMGGSLSQDQRVQVDKLSNVQVFESEYRLEWMQNPWKDVAAAGRWLLRLRDRFEPDLIHLNNYAHGQLEWKSPVLMVGHSCVCSWMKAVRGCSAGSEWKRYRNQVQQGLHAADVVIAPTAHMLDDLQTHYGTLAKSRVIHNGQSSRGVGEMPRQPFILTAGRLWDEAKNIRLLAEIAERIAWPILVAGCRQHPDGCGRFKGGDLRLLGQLSHRRLQQLMARASIYALPAKYEPFGLTPLEAALKRCPLVLGEIGTLREVWGSAAAFESPDSPRDWTRRLTALIADAKTRNDLGEQAFRRARQYSVPRMAAHYYSAYCRLTQHRDPAAFHQPTKAAV